MFHYEKCSQQTIPLIPITESLQISLPLSAKLVLKSIELFPAQGAKIPCSPSSFPNISLWLAQRDRPREKPVIHAKVNYGVFFYPSYKSIVAVNKGYERVEIYLYSFQFYLLKLSLVALFRPKSLSIKSPVLSNLFCLSFLMSPKVAQSHGDFRSPEKGFRERVVQIMIETSLFLA